MALMNRIRILNFSYNNHARLISDETFDLYGGENVLLNMKNGGGKSVLTQLVMQPIVPKSKLMKRTMEDFFAGKGKKSPAYVLLEWKLEDQGGYLLTGIAMDNAESHKREQEERMQRVKYFTFTVAYKDQHPFDLTRIPLVWADESGKYPVDFKEARTKIGQAARDGSGLVQVFGERESQDYRKHLASFNIFQDEWKHLIREINESEGGLIEIFEKTRKSMDVLKDWMLPRVNEVIQKTSEDQAKLETMMENLVNEWIENEEYLQKRSRYQDFVGEMEVFGTEAEKLAELMDQKTDTLRQLAGLHGYLLEELEKTGRQQRESQKRQETIQEELERIDNEEDSQAYYREADLAVQLKRVFEEKEADSALANQAYEEAELAYKEHQAADYKRQIEKDQGRLRAVEVRLKEELSDEERKAQKQNVGHSLLVGYRQEAGKCEEEMVTLEKVLSLNEKEMEAWHKKRKDLESQQIKLREATGRLKQKRDGMKEAERDLADRINFRYERNMLGEINPKDIETFEDTLKKQLEDQQQAEIACKEEQASLRNREAELDARILEERQSLEDKKLAAREAQQGLQAYRDQESALAQIYQRNGRDFALRFHYEGAQEWMAGIYQDRVKELRACEFVLKQKRDEKDALNHDRYHASEALIHWLEERDIEFVTGESYLKNLEEDRRDQILQKHPLLPFGVLFDEEAYLQVESVLDRFIDRSAIPIFRYDALSEKGRRVDSNQAWRVYAPYQKVALDRKQFPKLLEALDKKMTALQEQQKGFVFAVDQARKDLEAVRAFDFGAEAEADLEAKLKKAVARVAEGEASLEAMETEGKACRLRETELIEDLHRLDTVKKDLVSRQENFHAFLRMEKSCKEIEGDLDACLSAVKNLESELTAGIHAQEVRQEKDVEGRQRKLSLDQTLRGLNQSLEAYREYETGEMIDASLASLQSQWDAMMLELKTTTQELERQRNNLIKSLEEGKAKLGLLGISQERLAVLAYRPDEDARIAERVERTRAERERTNRACQLAELEFSKQQSKLQEKLEALEKQGRALLTKDQIHANFKERRKTAKNKLIDEREQEAFLNHESRRLERLSDRIEAAVDLKAVGAVVVVQLEVEAEAAFDEWRNQLRALKETIYSQDRVLLNRFARIDQTFCQEEDRPKKLLRGIRVYMEKKTRAYEDYYHMSDKLVIDIKKMRDLLRSFEQKLAGLEKNRENLIRQTYMQAKRAYDELLKIENHSRVALDGGSPRKMIRVRMAAMEETDAENWAKMEAYVKARVEATKTAMETGKSNVEIRRMIHQQMSTFELLGVLTDLSQFEVEAYKIDINKKNRRYKSWEKVVRENSGGERFVSFFALLVALMSYSRTSQRATDDYSRNQDTKVLIMDNPFGPITSAHLLEPLFQIAKQYRTQLICLTDIKTKAVWDCFKVIYVLKIRSNALGTREYVKAELELRDQELESLEKAVFRSEETSQIRLEL